MTLNQIRVVGIGDLQQAGKPHGCLRRELASQELSFLTKTLAAAMIDSGRSSGKMGSSQDSDVIMGMDEGIVQIGLHNLFHILEGLSINIHKGLGENLQGIYGPPSHLFTHIPRKLTARDRQVASHSKWIRLTLLLSFRE